MILCRAPNSNGLHPSKSSVRDRVKPSNNKTRVTKQKRETRDQFDNLNENVNYEKEYILNEKTGLMEKTENTDVVHEAELSVIANRDQDRPKEVVVLSDINLSKKKNTALISKNKPIILNEIDKNFDIFSNVCNSKSTTNFPLKKTAAETFNVDEAKTLNHIDVNINVHGSLSSDDNEDYMKISKFSQNSREPLISITTNKKPKRLLKKPIRKENIKPAKRFKKFLNSSTTTEEDLISTHSDSDIIDVLSDITNFESDTPKLIELN